MKPQRDLAFVEASLAAIIFLYRTNFAAKAAPTKEDRANELFWLHKADNGDPVQIN